MDEEQMDLDAALAALKDIEKTLLSYRGLAPKDDELATESEAVAEEPPAAIAVEIEAEPVAEEKMEDEPIRVVDYGMKSKSAPPVDMPPAKRGPGRPKKVR
jgi:hypothetical protein